MLLLLGLIPISAQAQAQTGQVTFIDVPEYGLYTAEVEHIGTDSSGIAQQGLGNIVHETTTRTVPARLGVHFGFRYRIVGAPNGAPVEVTKVTTFPPAGVLKPGTAEPTRGDRYSFTRRIGETSYTDYSFDNPWELVPGTWTMTLSVNGEVLASESFTVVKQ
jgi:hypothetical protein